MSKAAKTSIFILMALLLVSLGYAGYTLMEKQKLVEEKAGLEIIRARTTAYRDIFDIPRQLLA